MKAIVKKAGKGRWSWRIESDGQRLALGHAPTEQEAKLAAGQYMAKNREET